MTRVGCACTSGLGQPPRISLMKSSDSEARWTGRAAKLSYALGGAIMLWKYALIIGIGIGIGILVAAMIPGHTIVFHGGRGPGFPPVVRTIKPPIVTYVPWILMGGGALFAIFG